MATMATEMAIMAMETAMAATTAGMALLKAAAVMGTALRGTMVPQAAAAAVITAAGTMKVNPQGYIRNITNESGHFQPTVAETLNYPQIFRNSYLNVDNTWIKISEFNTSLSNYVIDMKIFYNGPIQYMP